MRQGWGVYTYVNGDTYEGEWNDNLRNGQGTYTFIASKAQVIFIMGKWTESDL